MKLTRPAIRYLGGKWKIASWIIQHLPPHKLYVEPYGGAASVLLRKPRSHGEIYNDLNGEVVNLFSVLRDSEKAVRLVRLVALTPFSREEFLASYQPSDDPVERARRLVARSYMGFGSNAANAQRNTGFRSNADRPYRTPAQEWGLFPPALAAVAERVQSGVVIESLPALTLMAKHDRADALFYVDPPYVPSMRSAKVCRGERFHSYAHDMDEADHADMLEALRGLRAMVVLSGYPCPQYDRALTGWRRVERPAMADGARPRTEVIWINPAASQALQQQAAA